jgi:hypothetical protein
VPPSIASLPVSLDALTIKGIVPVDIAAIEPRDTDAMNRRLLKFCFLVI